MTHVLKLKEVMLNINNNRKIGIYDPVLMYRIIQVIIKNSHNRNCIFNNCPCNQK